MGPLAPQQASTEPGRSLNRASCWADDKARPQLGDHAAQQRASSMSGVMVRALLMSGPGRILLMSALHHIKQLRGPMLIWHHICRRQPSQSELQDRKLSARCLPGAAQARALC